MVNRRIGLDEVFKRADAQLVAVQGGHNPHAHTLPHVKRVANRQNHVADLQIFVMAQCDVDQAFGLDFEHGKVAVRVSAHKYCRHFAAII